MKPRMLFRQAPLALAALLSYGILTLWIPGRWALGLYQVAALGAVGAWGVWLAVRPSPVRWTGLLLPLLLVPAWGIVQIVSGETIYRWETWNSVLNWTVDCALFFLAFQILAHTPVRERFLKWLLYFGAALSVISTLQLFTSGGKIFWLFPSGYSDLVLGPFVYKNQYAAFIETILPLALYRGITSLRPFRYWIMAGVMVASVIASASRTGALLVIAEVVIIPVLAWLRGVLPLRTTALALGVGIAMSVAFTAIVGWNVIWNRFHEADPYQTREQLLRSSVQMVHDRPAMGFGLGTWSTAYPAYALYDDGLFANQAHNDWAQWAVEGGLPLFAAMLVFGTMLAFMAWNSIWGLGLVSVMLHSMVDYPMQQRPALAGWFFAMAGVLAAAHAASKHATADRRWGGPR